MQDASEESYYSWGGGNSSKSLSSISGVNIQNYLKKNSAKRLGNKPRKEMIYIQRSKTTPPPQKKKAEYSYQDD